MDAGHVDSLLDQRVRVEPLGSLHGEGQPAAVGDVAARVLVEERVLEDEPRLPDARGAVDERDLAEERRPVVARDLRADHLGAVALCLHVHDLATLEPQLEPLDALADAGHDEGIGRSHHTFCPAPVRRREHLLRGDVRQVLDPGLRLERRAHPARAAEQADDEVGARPAEADRVELRSVERVCARLEHRGVRAPGLDGILLVEAHRRGNGLPEPLHVRLAEDGLGPAGVRSGHDDPVQLPAHHERQVDHPDVARLRLRDELGVEPVEERRLRVAGEGDQRRPGVVPGADPLEEMLRRPAELGLGAVLDRSLAEMEVGDDGVHAQRTRLERRPSDDARDGRVLDQVEKHDLLTRLDVRSDPDDQVGEAVEALVGRHRARR